MSRQALTPWFAPLAITLSFVLLGLVLGYNGRPIGNIVFALSSSSVLELFHEVAVSGGGPWVYSLVFSP